MPSLGVLAALEPRCSCVCPPTRLWPLEGRVHLLHPHVFATQAGPRAQLEAEKETSLQKEMKDFGNLISEFASNMISIFHVFSPMLDMGEGESRGLGPALKSLLLQAAAGAEDVLSQEFRHGVLRVIT